MNNMPGIIIIGVGLIFNLFGCVGLIRFPDLFTRIHGSVKPITLGTSLILLGLIVIRGFDIVSVKALLCIAFIIFTVPVSAHVIARAAYRSGVKPSHKEEDDEYMKTLRGTAR